MLSAACLGEPCTARRLDRGQRAVRGRGSWRVVGSLSACVSRGSGPATRSDTVGRAGGSTLENTSAAAVAVRGRGRRPGQGVEADQRVTGEQAVMGGDMVTNRAERVARNESTARAVNERLERGHRDQNQPAEHLRILCECGWPDCDRVIALTVAEYEHVRADPREFLVVAD